MRRMFSSIGIVTSFSAASAADIRRVVAGLDANDTKGKPFGLRELDRLPALD